MDPAITIDPDAIGRWLQQPMRPAGGPSHSAHLGITEEDFGCDTEGFLTTLDDLLASQPHGVEMRPDILRIGLWRISDGDALDQGALITVDLANGVRLASRYQDLSDLCDVGQRGAAAAVSALHRIAAQVDLMLGTYRRATQPPQSD